MASWNHGDDVVLQVAGKCSLLGKTIGKQWDDGRVTVQWNDRTRTVLRGDLLVTPGEAAAAPTWAEVSVGELIGERDRARDFAARIEAELHAASLALAAAGIDWLPTRNGGVLIADAD